MEKASTALVGNDYFACVTLSRRALEKAHEARDFERMARIVMPLQEARRQIRQLAVDAGYQGELSALPGRGDEVRAGCWLLTPPLVGMDARFVNELAQTKRTPVMLVTREPTTRSGEWPIVGVGTGEPQPRVVRVKLAPPEGGVVTLAWFQAAQERLGDEALARVDRSQPAAHQVEDLLELLEAVPDHEKLHQGLEAACRAAAREPMPTVARRRPVIVDPWF